MGSIGPVPPVWRATNAAWIFPRIRSGALVAGYRFCDYALVFWSKPNPDRAGQTISPLVRAVYWIADAGRLFIVVQQFNGEMAGCLVV